MLVISCITIFLARIIDVSLGTIRTFLVVQGKKKISVILAFFEVLIWFVVAKEALNTNVRSILVPIFYAGGYATGVLLGSYFSEKYIDGLTCTKAIIKNSNSSKLIKEIKIKGFGYSLINLDDNKDKVMLFINHKKSSYKMLLDIINKIEKEAFITSSDVRFIKNGLIK